MRNDLFIDYITLNSTLHDVGCFKLIPKIKQIIFNNPATIIIWADNTKTIVKCYNEPFDEEKGFAMAILKRAYNGRNTYMKYIENATRQENKKCEKN